MHFPVVENRYKYEVLVDGEPVLFEILDTCPKVRNLRKQVHRVISSLVQFRVHSGAGAGAADCECR